MVRKVESFGSKLKIVFFSRMGKVSCQGYIELKNCRALEVPQAQVASYVPGAGAAKALLVSHWTHGAGEHP